MLLDLTQQERVALRDGLRLLSNQPGGNGLVDTLLERLQRTGVPIGGSSDDHVIWRGKLYAIAHVWFSEGSLGAICNVREEVVVTPCPFRAGTDDFQTVVAGELIWAPIDYAVTDTSEASKTATA